MIFTESGLPGAFLVDIQKHEDDRGFFARTWCAREFQEHGLIACTVQSNVSFNRKKGTLRGLHYQIPPSQEAKLVRVTSGAVFDVIVFVPSMEEDESRITCGNAVLADEAKAAK